MQNSVQLSVDIYDKDIAGILRATQSVFATNNNDKRGVLDGTGS